MYEKLLERDALCTGCGACVNICPKNAIDYYENVQEDGSLVAKIDYDKCVSCNRCNQVCPVLNKLDNKNRIAENCYAVWAKDEIRNESSSGGAFTVLAEHILKNDGYICAVAYGQEFCTEHIIIHDVEELERVRRSKYIQSNIGFIYRQLLSKIETGKPVMFIGTPCQVAGAKAYLGRDYDNLVMVDIYCNYAPAYSVFKRYLTENFDVSQIEQVNFRVKSHGWLCGIHEIKFHNGQSLECFEYNDMFQRGYHSKLLMRKTCEKCLFAGNPRQGDLSIADFWYIKDFYPKLDDTKGTSCVVLNNEKGKRLFDQIKTGFKMCQEVPIDCMKYNRGATAIPHTGRNRFYELIKEMSFNEAVDYALNGKYDVAVWGNWSEKNYGSELTYYALYHVLRDMGIKPLLVERPKSASWKPNDTVALFRKQPYPEDALHTLYENKVCMYELNEKCNTFIVGSDQIWHRNLYKEFGEVAFLDYIYNDKKKIAYASSFGREYWTGNQVETQEVAYYLKDFDYVSVREESGIKICDERFHVHAECVLDPVFLCDKKHYLDLLSSAEKESDEPYIGGYILDLNDNKVSLLKQVEAYLGLKSRLITDAFIERNNTFRDINLKQNAACEDWVQNIVSSNFVITDSFHGMCFSIIFNKQFIAVINPERGSVRFTDFLKKLGLENRLITSEEIGSMGIQGMLESRIDYDKVNKILESERIRSRKWLLTAISGKKEYEMSLYDVLLRKIQNAEISMNNVALKVPDMEKEIGNRTWDIGVHRKELDELRQGLENEAGNRTWDISVHRNEINELRAEINELLGSLNTINGRIEQIERNWCVRLGAKIRSMYKRIRR